MDAIITYFAVIVFACMDAVILLLFSYFAIIAILLLFNILHECHFAINIFTWMLLCYYCSFAII